jgi:hypothetical protein
MALSDPQSVTINSVAVSLPRVNTGSDVGKFTNYDAKTSLEVRPVYGKRTRRNSRINHAKIVTDPLVSTTNQLVSASIIFTLDVPQSGYSAAEQLDLAKAHLTWLSANSYANLIKVIAGEN